MSSENGTAPSAAFLDEQIVLGGAMASTGNAEALAKIIRESDFGEQKHRLIWSAIRSVYATGAKAASYDLVSRNLDAIGLEQKVGGVPYLSACHTAARDADGDLVTWHGQRVADTGHLRRQQQQAERHHTIVTTVTDPEKSAQLLAALGAEMLAEVDRVPAKTTTEPTHLDALRAALVDCDGLDDIPDPEPLIGDDILFRDSLNWMVGKPGCGKSFTALDMAGCVGTGEHWQGYPVQKGIVLYLVAEGVRGIKKRVRAWEQAMGQRMTGVRFLPVAVQSKNPAQWRAFVDLAAEIQPVMVVIDTQARVTVGVEENSNTEMGEFVHHAEQLRTASAAGVVIVHHIGRNGDTGRGATTLDGALSTVIKVTKDEDRIKLECTKNKDGAEWEPIDLRAVPMGESLVLMSDAGAVISKTAISARKWVKDWWDIFQDDPMTPAKLLSTLTVSESTFYRVVRELQNIGAAAKEGRGAQTRYRLCHTPTAT